MPHIVVIGSLNMDLVVEVPVIPAPGETVLGKKFATFAGGKGANQAVAAARLGAQVTLVGRVGADEFGRQLLERVASEGVNVDHVGVDPEEKTGVAMITVDAAGQNSIAVASGANYRLTAQQVEEAWAQLGKVDRVVMPLETPPETIEKAITLANEAGVPVVLNPAPARQVPAALLAGVAVLVPNEPETAQLTGMEVADIGQAVLAARQLLAAGVGNVVLTLGSNGALVVSSSAAAPLHIRPHRVTVVDTTAAGDAFVAGLAVAWAEGQSLAEAARFANATGALTVTKAGAQPSLPRREQVDQLLTEEAAKTASQP